MNDARDIIDGQRTEIRWPTHTKEQWENVITLKQTQNTKTKKTENVYSSFILFLSSHRPIQAQAKNAIIMRSSKSNNFEEATSQVSCKLKILQHIFSQTLS